MEDKSWVEKIRKDEFHVAIETSNEVRVVLPSLWNDFVRPGMTVLIIFMFDETKGPLKQPVSAEKREEHFTTHPNVEIMNVDVDVGETNEDESSPETNSLDEENSIHSDGSFSEDGDSISDGVEENSETPSASGGEFEISEAPSAKPVSGF